MYSQDLFASGDRFVNDGTTAVQDSLLGLACMNPDVGLFEFGNVMVRKDYTTMEGIKILSGGASGHEPSHAGFVGKGMLTAAIQGEVFRSPTTTKILKTIRELSYGQDFGVLVIIQNNAADRLNFGLAIERARNEGIFIKTLIVSEECCITNPLQGRRGLSGIVLVNKIAGAMAEMGHTLDEVYSFCQHVQDNMSSILLSLKSCTPPTLKTCLCTKNVNDNEIEIAAGLHGERGLKRIDKTTVKDVCTVIINDITSPMFVLDSTTPIVVLFNNLSNMLQMEELILVKELVSLLQEREIPVSRVYRGHFLTALDMRGFTVTILKVFDEKVLQYLDAPCEALGWHYHPTRVSTNFQEPISAKVKERKFQTTSGPQITQREANIVLLVIQFAGDALISCEKQINTLDSEFGSGNIGTKMKQGAQTIFNEIKNETLYFIYPKVFFQTLSNIAEKEIGGTIGALYSILFEAAANTLRGLSESSEVTSETWFSCLNEAVVAIKSYTKANFGTGTIYDPLYAAVTTIEEALQRNVGSLEAFGLGVTASEEIAQRTRQPGRKYPDAGAHTVSIWMRATYEALKVRLES